MSDSKWTSEQLQAITTINKNILVSAGAGSGKTSVLVERIINRVSCEDQQVDIDKMLVMTFTNAAAFEMKERIRHALHKKMNEQPDNANIARQMLLINRAVITTIHSFCSEVIRNNYHLLSIDPAFSICDQTKSEQLKTKAIMEVLLERYESKNPSFYNLVNSYGYGNDDKKIIELVYSIYNYIMSIPEPEIWLEDKMCNYDINCDDFFDCIWGSEIKKYSENIIDDSLHQLKKAIADICDDELMGGYYTTLLSDTTYIESLSESIKTSDFDTFRKVLYHVDFIRLGRNKKGADSSIVLLTKNIRNKVKTDIKSLGDMYVNDSKTQKQIFDYIKPHLKELSSIVLSFKEKYDELKAQNKLLDFNDLEHQCLYCLKNGANVIYQEQFEEILVDEYQDSNLVQEAILNYIKRDNNLFFVGDVKQSIYKFRNANPALFIDKYNTYSSNLIDNDVKIDLNLNFRSRIEILQLVNFIFERTMSINAGDIEYDKDKYLNFGASYYQDEQYACEILVAHGEEKIFSENEGKKTVEAALVASEIRKLIESKMKVLDKNTKELRKIRYSDIVILLRSVKNVTDDFVTVFKNYHIPVYADEAMSFFDHDDIARMISFLEIIDNPYQDIPLLSIMKSSFFHFTDEELVVITTNKKAQYIYDKVVSYDNSDCIKEKINHMLETIALYRNNAIVMSINTLIWKIITETGYYFYADNQLMLQKKQNNLRRLFEIAAQFEVNEFSNLFTFLQYVKEHKEGASDLVGSKNFGENDNVVKIMTIHKSKGLEFPVVFVSNCSKGFNKKDLQDSIILHRELGFGAEYIDYDKGFKFTSSAKQIIKKKMENEFLSEELRILYVAMTRAREKLYLTGYCKDIESVCDKWAFLGRENKIKMSYGNVLNGKNYLDWIMSSLVSHKNGKIISEHSSIQRHSFVDFKSDFNISFVDSESIKKTYSEKDSVKEDRILATNLSFEEIDKRFNWKYEYQDEVDLYRKISVTELKKLKETEVSDDLVDIFDRQLIEKPDFMSEKTLIDSAKRGTMIHNLFAYLDFKKVYNDQYLKDSLSDMALKKDDYILIKRFFNDDIGKRLVNAKKVYREISFMLPVNTVDLFSETKEKISSDHKTLVQGVIDCMFIEDDEVVVIDYKTDYVIEGEEKEKAETYRVQLDTYAKAVEYILHKKVKEKVVYLLHTGMAVTL